RDALSIEQELGAVFEPGRALTAPRLEEAFVDERAVVDGLVERIADHELARTANELALHRRHHALVDDDVPRARAALARGAERRPERAFDGELEIGVRENDQRILSAELERRHLQRAPGDLTDEAPDLRRSRERNFVHEARAGRHHERLARAARAAPV